MRPSAKHKIEMARDQLAGKEMDWSAASTWSKRDFTGAINRFKVVVTHIRPRATSRRRCCG